MPMSTSEADSLHAIDDASEWGTPKPGRKSEKRQRSAVVSVRMTQDELARVQTEARALDQTVGTYMREVALGCQQSKLSAPPGFALLMTGNALFSPHIDPLDHEINAWHEHRFEPLTNA